jgi:hypothetical protein
MVVCRVCSFEHPTSLEALACDEVNGGRAARFTCALRTLLRESDDETWEAAVEIARARRERAAGRARAKRRRRAS